MAGHLSYRLAREEDIPNLLRLWERHSGWGSMTAEQWRTWYFETPYEPALVALAEDEDCDVVGQLVFTPARVLVGGRHVPALRLSSPILHPGWSAAIPRGSEHPAVHLYLAGLRSAAERGFKLVYAYTQRNWLPFLLSGERFGLPRAVASEYDCVERPITVTTLPDGTGGLKAVPIDMLGPEHAALWRVAVESFPIEFGVIRTEAWLRYKYGARLVLEARGERDGTLVGYVVLKEDGLILEILAREAADLPRIIAAVSNHLAARPDEQGQIKRLKAMATPLLSPALSALGFEPVDYTFAFICSTLDPTISLQAIDPARWYLAPGD
jgi:hypothetical protein